MYNAFIHLMLCNASFIYIFQRNVVKPGKTNPDYQKSATQRLIGFGLRGIRTQLLERTRAYRRPMYHFGAE